MEVALATVLDHRHVRLHDRDLCVGQILHEGKRAGVIGMPVVVGAPVLRRIFPSEVTNSHELKPRVPTK